ncbi:MAG: ATP-binding cassette domain-containing protein [Clostridiales bacterium]|jgi:energy-coupling factor transporter ATP-binding protein EcfA2/uncharacterized membrane protein|nr:ATP-binding cassette domain-containing protein [Clostridiales bacterium]
MESYRIENLTFSYPKPKPAPKPALKNINLTISAGEFIALCGPSGCGKTTLLRQLAPAVAPFGERNGRIYFEGRPLSELTRREQSEKIGFVAQNPENQLVTDKVWHELAFALESLGLPTPEIRLRAAETAAFFGIQNWFYRDVSELSGGQKQLLNLAAAMVAQPSVLILDEPASQLDPIAAADFLTAVGRVNRELGVTVLMTEHRLEEVFPLASRAVYMDGGEIFCAGAPSEVGAALRGAGGARFMAMPTPMRVCAAVPNGLDCPVTIREGRDWLAKMITERGAKPLPPVKTPESPPVRKAPPAVLLDEVWFRYEKGLPDAVKGLSLRVNAGDFLCVLGGNGTGKSTALSLICGVNKPYRGKVRIFGRELKDYTDGELFGGILGVLPQNPQALFAQKTVRADLLEALSGRGLDGDEKDGRVRETARLCRLEELLEAHPGDLSGGERQRAALAKILLPRPRALLLDEPTKGLDAEFKLIFAGILRRLNERGAAVVMVSHDIEFCAEHGGVCAFFFDGGILSAGTPREFFSGKSFYTTAASRMARGLIDGAATAGDIIAALGGPAQNESGGGGYETSPQAPPEAPQAPFRPPGGKRRPPRRALASAFMTLLAVPLTICAGVYFLGDRKHYFISVLILLEAMLSFALIFEGRGPRARELVIISALCAIGTAGRAAFFMVPQFKPAAALVIVSGAAFGGETGFLVGAATAFASNMFFGQGPWTVWQMFAFGLVGFLAGALFQKGLLRRGRASLCVFGAAAAFFVYGGVMNFSQALMYYGKPSLPAFAAECLRGAPFDLIHAAATALFLWAAAEPMLEKLERVRLKYGL